MGRFSDLYARAMRGAPRFYDTPEQMQVEIDGYFASLEIPLMNEQGQIYDYELIEPPTTTGLCLYLGFSSRQSLYDYRNRFENFAYTIKNALELIEYYHEKNITQGRNFIGSMFLLKCSFNYVEKSIVETHTINKTLEISFDEDKKEQQLLPKNSPEQNMLSNSPEQNMLSFPQEETNIPIPKNNSNKNNDNNESDINKKGAEE